MRENCGISVHTWKEGLMSESSIERIVLPALYADDLVFGIT
jgi:hypothetical protein